MADEYITIDSEGKITCNVIVNEHEKRPCGLPFKSVKKSNIKRHLERAHPGTFNEHENQINRSVISNPFHAAKTAAEKRKRKASELDLQSESQVISIDSSMPGPSSAPQLINLSQNSPSSGSKKHKKGTVNSARKNKIMENFVELSRISIFLPKPTLKEALIDMVTTDGRPFSIVNDIGFRKILDPILAGYPGKKMVISAEKIPFMIAEEAENIKKEIISIFSKIMFSLKIDIVTRLEKGYLGVNAQTILNGKIVMRVLGCLFLEEKHTALYVKEKIEELLQAYGLDLGQIYSITYDNGRNMVKAGKLLSNAAADKLLEDLTSKDLHTDDEPETVDTDGEISQIQKEWDAEDVIAKNSKEQERYSNYFERELKTALETLSSLSVLCARVQMGINDLRCVAHTLQLAVEAVFKALADPEFYEETSLMEKVRDLQKYLRTPAIKREILRYNKHHPDEPIKMPVTDMQTRWMSSYDMLQSCLQSRIFCDNDNYYEEGKDKDNGEGGSKCRRLTASEYDEIQVLLKNLEPAKIATLKFQEEQLTIPDMALTFQRIKVELRGQTGTYPELLYAEILRREKKLFSQTAVLCALYLDPRTYMLVPLEEIKSVQEHLLFLGNRLQAMKCETAIVRAENEEDFESLSEVELETEEMDKLDSEMHELAKKREKEKIIFGGRAGSSILDSNSIESEIKSFETPPVKLKSKDSVLEFWENYKHTLPALYELSRVVLAAPPTQVSVERLFSGLKFILNPLRNGIKPKTVDNIMLVRTNKIFQAKNIL